MISYSDYSSTHKHTNSFASSIRAILIDSSKTAILPRRYSTSSRSTVSSTSSTSSNEEPSSGSENCVVHEKKEIQNPQNDSASSNNVNNVFFNEDPEAMELMKSKFGHAPSVLFFVRVAESSMNRVKKCSPEDVKLLQEQGNAPLVFYNKTLPRVNLKLYLGRLVYLTNIKYSEDSNRHFYPNDYLDSVGIRCLTLACIYVERLCSRNKIKLDILNVHKIYAAAFVAGLKFIEDEQLHAKVLAEICGIDRINLHSVLLEFCNLSSFSFTVPSEEYSRVFHMFATS